MMELMVVVAIVGVLAALGLPAFTGYLRQSKTAEAVANIQNIFKSASSFYVQEHALQGLTGDVSTHCIVQSSTQSPLNPINKKQKFSAAEGFQTLGFSIGDYVYYGYGITSIAPANTTLCAVSNNTATLYTFYAHGDIDGDSLQSTFMISTGSDDEGQLYHSRGLYVQYPIE